MTLFAQRTWKIIPKKNIHTAIHGNFKIAESCEALDAFQIHFGKWRQGNAFQH